MNNEADDKSTPDQRWTQAKALIASIRMHQHYRARKGPTAIVLRKLARLRYMVWSTLTASDIDPAATLGEGLRLPHPTGVVIHRDAVLGPNCMVMQQVTIGQLAADGAPKLGANVYVGAGAKILGDITLGDDVRIGANAVVLKDVPAGCTVVGIPASIVRRQGGNV